MFRPLPAKTHYVPEDLRYILVHHAFDQASLKPFFDILKAEMRLTVEYEEVCKYLDRAPLMAPENSPVHALAASLYEEMVREATKTDRTVNINFDLSTKNGTEVKFDIITTGNAHIVHDAVATHATTSSDQAHYAVHHMVYRNNADYKASLDGAAARAAYGFLNTVAHHFGGKKPISAAVLTFDKALPIENKVLLTEHTDPQMLVTYPPLASILSTINVVGHHVETELNGLPFRFQTPVVILVVLHMHRIVSPITQLKFDVMFGTIDRKLTEYVSDFQTSYATNFARLQSELSDTSPLSTEQDANYLRDVFKRLGIKDPHITNANIAAARTEIAQFSEQSYKKNVAGYFSTFSPEQQKVLHHYIFDRGGKHYLRLDWFTFLSLCAEHGTRVQQHQRIVNPSNVHTLKLVRVDGEPVKLENKYANVGIKLVMEPRYVQDTDTDYVCAWRTAEKKTGGSLWGKLPPLHDE